MKKIDKATMKRILIGVSILVITIILAVLINAILFRHTEGLVYRTKTGNCYHSPGCGYLWNSAIPMGYQQAKASSLTSCSRCGGNPKGTIVVNNYVGSFAFAICLEVIIGFLGLLIYNRINKTSINRKPKASTSNQEFILEVCGQKLNLGCPLVKIKSWKIKAVGFDENRQLLYVQFRDNSVYAYQGITRHIYNRLLINRFDRVYFSTYIKKGGYERVRFR